MSTCRGADAAMTCLQLGQSSLSSHLLHHGPCPTLVIPFKSMSSEGSVPEGGLPVISPDGAVEMSPRESLDTTGPVPHPNSAPSHRRTSVGACHSNTYMRRDACSQSVSSMGIT